MATELIPQSQPGIREVVMPLAEPMVARLGYELVDVEWLTEVDHQVLRFYIDHGAAGSGDSAGAASGAAHISVDDCAVVSRALSALLDEHDLVANEYLLEVSSPGLDRPLRTPAHFARSVGARVRIELQTPRAGQRRYTGTLLRVDDAGIEIEMDTGQVVLPFSQIGKARVAA